MLVMVTGSRTWDRYDPLETVLDAEARRLGTPMLRDSEGHPIDWDWRLTGGLTLLHGDCPDGADQLAVEYGRRHDVPVQPEPANWRRPDGTLDRGAGFRRNAYMVGLKPDLVIGLVDRCAKPTHQSSPHGSHGSIHALNLAQAARIRTIIFYRRFLLESYMLEAAEEVVEL